MKVERCTTTRGPSSRRNSLNCGAGLGQSIDQHQDAEREECELSANLNGLFRESLPQCLAHPDGQCVSHNHAGRRASPRSDSIRVSGESDGGKHRLVAEFGEEEHRADGDDDVLRGDVRGLLVVLRQLVPAERPCPEEQECEATDHGHCGGGQRRAEDRTDTDRHKVDDSRGSRYRNQHGHCLEPCCERKCHQLALVAEFGDEDDPETQQEGMKHGLRT